MPGKRWIFFALALALAMGGTHAQRQKKGLVGFNTPKETDLESLRRHPEAYKSVWITLTLQYGGLSKVYNPFFTKFVPADYICFAAWGGEQEIWKLDEFRRDFHFFFVDKRSNTALQLFRMKRFQRCKVVGFVRNTFQGTPWVEISSIEPQGESLDQATLYHFIRGRTLMKKKQWHLAQTELAKACAQSGLPTFARGEMWHDMSLCLLKQGDFPQAKEALAKARTALPESPRLAALADLVARDPGKVMEEKVDLPGLKPWQKPLWRDKKDEVARKSGIGRIRRSPTRKVTTPPDAGKASPPKE